jgi:hypothetical protein
MPARKEKNYQVVEVLGPGDEIVAIKTPTKPSKWLEKNEGVNSFPPTAYRM